MKKILVLFLLSIGLFILDNALMPFFAVRTFYPSLLLIFIICYSIVNGKWEGLWLGVFTGILQDIYFSQGFGMNSFTNMIVCIAAGFIGDSIFREKRIVPVISCFLLILFKGILMWGILYLAGAYVNMANIFFSGIYDMVLCIFIYKPVYNFCRKDYMQLRWKF
ncbi:rod shape-determining protein MreD [Clostridium luticellarii]|jgi:rod shape-determining protein MreD|uniref:Rod shape-determining protein MreD n=1 Tax=Clostridium luticellarii TaxID=1691940 RepID=A0A2T0BPF8_9CLOT|nr:rod shape-determining protein MreD [Clostridium luticellarii]MCI1945807.1 rod shape-determining protein MreD [Clostridium luticellarii]MCI1967597.1 rod shape-determining protein MreD [Clostridium luticellarii]MCI1995705.1 rod shape-determining protein MreD [Clostridium luticellarii]MCI2040043.1 rod shape-determining protein MreD [Clostridium luticellarii]PRR85753.1 rod shape-determining protein MreD [Clostridium luticellarii]